ncbi:polysaccharide deacetylase family protein [Paenibacillus profundus]|uniref:Polysaccharide deacetylase family protein n=1 Tax=Paenibacillus profundus TaxID=1173085 RepID=A0ABS8Y9V6_9BACL|nr:polysaccharide deacetylase family protein [Paenibacillus profundus]MCE5168107.1 polysaccharide deacetylase family protein [Paenibacillus profundus]
MDAMRPIIWKWIVIAASVLGVLLIASETEVGTFIQERKADLVMSEAFQTDSIEALEHNPLMQRIMAEAKQHEVAPINARIDRVWKAIPGYNGVEADIERTYKANKGKLEQDKLKWILREVKPEVSLRDLEPQPIYRGNPNKPMVALMINVAWGNEFITPMLKVLQEEKVKASFFLDGSWLSKNPDVAKQIQAEGHELENHAYTHPNMSELSAGLQSQQIEKTKRLLKETLGVENKWFAPPSGDFNALTVTTAHAHGLSTVLWTLDTVDWKKPEPSTILQKIRKKVEPGTLILMHPTSSSSRALQDMIRIIKDKGFHPGTVSDTLSEQRVPLVPVERR